jgi:hypothetical protein
MPEQESIIQLQALPGHEAEAVRKIQETIRSSRSSQVPHQFRRLPVAHVLVHNGHDLLPALAAHHALDMHDGGGVLLHCVHAQLAPCCTCGS